MQDDVRSVPLNDFLSQNPRSRATRVTPPNRSKITPVRELLDESDDDDDDDDIECTGSVLPSLSRRHVQTNKFLLIF